MTQRGLWSHPGVPHKGWTCVNVEDHEEPTETCEMCGNESVRFLHVMEHPEHGPVKAGCVCASRMEQDYRAAKGRERHLRNWSARRNRFVAKPWRRSRNGNYFLRTPGHVFIAMPSPYQPGRWAAARDGKFSPVTFADFDEIKLRVFEYLNPRPTPAHEVTA